MEIKVLALSQELSFEDSSITNILLLKLPSGRSIRAVISDGSAKMLFEDLASHATGAPHVTELPPDPPAPVAPKPTQSETNSSLEEGAVEFGGEGETAGEYESPAMWIPSNQEIIAAAVPQEALKVWTDAESQARAFRTKASQDKKNIGKSNRGITVPKNDRGYPMVSNSQGVDVSSVVGGGSGADEEGVGQI